MKQVIHIHVPRTAGKSMMSWGSRYADSYQSLYRSRSTVFDPSMHWTYFGHAKLDDLRKKGVTRKWYDGCFKFAFVRNSWDRLVSLFAFHSSRRWWITHSVGRELDTFDRYARWIVSGQGDWPKFREGQLPWLRTGVDFLGRYETLDEDWDRLCGLIGMERRPLGWRNAGRRGDYREYYDDDLRKLVADFYADEIAEFGFTF